MKKKVKKEKRTRGILTAADSAYIEPLRHLLKSIDHKESVCVIDIGLTPDQVREVQDGGASCPAHEWTLPESVNARVVWEKPFYLLQSPFDDTLWIDADARVIGDLEPLWEKDPWVVNYQGSWPSGDNDSRLYTQFPVPSRIPPTSMINTGVMRWSKESMWLPVFVAWCDMVKLAGAEVHVRKLIAACDEGALVWAINKTEAAEMIVGNQGWNRLVGNGWKPEVTDVIHHYIHGAWRRRQFGGNG